MSGSAPNGCEENKKLRAMLARIGSVGPSNWTHDVGDSMDSSD